VIAFLRTADSPFASALARAGGAELTALELEPAPGAIRIDGASVRWQGVDLGSARAVFVERPLFAWPQRLRPDRDERAARALALSALHAVAERVPVLDPPGLAALAAAPLDALARLGEAGVAVHPWSSGPRRPADAPVWLDVAGRVGGYEPRPPAATEPGWSPAPLPAGGPVLEVLVIGERVVGARVHEELEAWAGGSEPGALPAPEVPQPAAELARRAARALGAELAEVALVLEPTAVLFARPGPDGSTWFEALGPSVVEALWRHLEEPR